MFNLIALALFNLSSLFISPETTLVDDHGNGGWTGVTEQDHGNGGWTGSAEQDHGNGGWTGVTEEDHGNGGWTGK